MSDLIGDLIEKEMKMSIEWRVPNFFYLPSRVDKLESAVFFFGGLAWRFGIFPNGKSKPITEGIRLRKKMDVWVGLYLYRVSSGQPKTVTFTLGLRKSDGEENVIRTTSHTFEDVGGYGVDRFYSRSLLRSQEDQLVPANTLTVSCTLRAEDGHFLDASLNTRLWNLSLNLAAVKPSREDADVMLKLPDGELDAHEMILKARSSVFRRMFSRDDFKEGRTGEVKIEECNKEAFQVVLAYIYTGDPQGVSPENVKDVYKISHKYDLRDLTQCCSDFMGARLLVETFCDVVRMALLYQDMRLMDNAKDYFVTHRNEIVKTDQWKTLKGENHEIVYEIVEYALIKI